MKIAVIGGTGRLGGAVAREAASRGHEVTALGSADVDVTDPARIRQAVTGQDAVVVSVRGPVQQGARALLEAEVRRFVFVGGAGSLLTTSGQRRVDIGDVPAHIRQASLAQAEALEILRNADSDLEWSYLSPPPVPLVDGPATGAYQAEARETPIVEPADGVEFRVGDLAAAVIDALEQGRFIRQRFTVG